MARDRYRSFRLTHLGRKLVALAEDTARYAALSRAGVPAVAALAHELLTRFPEVRKVMRKQLKEDYHR